MKNKFTIYLLLPALLIYCACKEDRQEKYETGKNIGAVHISKEKPQPGDTIVMTYYWENENDELEIDAFYHYFVGLEAYPKDINLTVSSGEWKGKIIIPDSATAVAINISRHGKVDHNSKKGFVFPLYDNEEKLIPGSTASTGYFYHRLKSQYEVENDSSLVLIAQDLNQYPHLKKDWDETYARLLNSSNKEEARKYIDGRIRDYSEENLQDEKALSHIFAFYNILNNKEKTDSIQKIIAQRFPLGEIIKSQHIRQFYETSDLQKKQEILEEYHQKFGKTDTHRDNYMLVHLANIYAGKADWENFEKYSNQIPNNVTKGQLFTELAISLADKPKDLNRAERLAKRSYNSLQDTGKIKDFSYGTQRQFKKILDHWRKRSADTYAFILFQQGDTKQALQYQKEAVGDGQNGEYNERYLEMLIADEQYEKAHKEAAGFIAANSANTRTKEYYKEAYFKLNGSNTGLEESLAQLERKGYEQARRNLKKEMLNEEAPDFRLTDLNGNEIILNSLKGKTVILDFWATWCKPCIDDFPGMQLAVEKYKDDEEVEFLFVNTLEIESGETLDEKIRNFLEKNNYSFQVLMDRQTKEGVKGKTAKDFNVYGIPVKVIIGPDGRIKFRKIGGSGNDAQIVQELDLMIDLLNTSDKSTS